MQRSQCLSLFSSSTFVFIWSSPLKSFGDPAPVTKTVHKQTEQPSKKPLFAALGWVTTVLALLLFAFLWLLSVHQEWTWADHVHFYFYSKTEDFMSDWKLFTCCQGYKNKKRGIFQLWQNSSYGIGIVGNVDAIRAFYSLFQLGVFPLLINILCLQGMLLWSRSITAV